MTDSMQLEVKPKTRKLLPRLLANFIQTEAGSGIIMIAFAVYAVIAANSIMADHYYSLIGTPISFGYGERFITEPLKVWVKDILMVFFFLIIGMELKREMLEGFLADRKQILLPCIAAIGGMAIPALLFVFINRDTPVNMAGWAIPSATDIAFALCIVTLMGKRVPPALKIFLLAIAIFDDLGAIIIIATFYSHGFALTPLLLALIGMGLLWIFNRTGVHAFSPYFIVGVFLWFCFFHSGIHTTIAGVIVGMSIPMRDRDDPRHSPLNKAMHLWHPWVSFCVLPIFAFTSAGISLSGLNLASLMEPLPFGIAMGLFVGKQIGIFGATWLVIKLKLAKLPAESTWLQIYAVSILAGIGFTMSLFIGVLAFRDESLHDMVKIGVIGGSLLSAIWGSIVLKFATRHRPEPHPLLAS